MLLQGESLMSYALEYTGNWWIGATLYDLRKVRELWPKIILAGTALDLSLHLHLGLVPEGKVFLRPPWISSRVSIPDRKADEMVSILPNAVQDLQSSFGGST